MPLVRFEVRSEYALGAPDLYGQVNKEDPREILEGIAVSGLVGVLRQLGDLAEFAAEVFHGLQDDVMITSARSHKLMARVQHIESALPPLEKAVLAQRSHLHLAYATGSNWHAHIKCEENHFLCSDVPQFIMDSYEGSRGCPHLHLLDRFDPGGSGSCLKRYSDPTFFKRASVASGEASTKNITKDKQSRKIKKLKQKRRSSPRIREVSRGPPFFYHGGRTHLTQHVDGNSTSQMTYTRDTREDIRRSDMGEQSNLDFRNGSGYIESDICSSYSIQHEELESRESMSSPAKRHVLHHNSLEQKASDIYGLQISPSQDQPNYNSSFVTWDEKTDTVESTTQEYDTSGTTLEFNHARNTVSCSSKLNSEIVDVDEVNMETIDKNDVVPDEALPTLKPVDILVEDIDSETDQFMDALNTIESDFETDTNCTKKKEGCYSDLDDIGADYGVGDLTSRVLNPESNVLTNLSTITVSCEQDPVLRSSESSSTAYSSISEKTAKTESMNDNKFLSAIRTGESLNREGLQKVDPLEKIDIDSGALEVCVSNTILSDCRDDISGLTVVNRARSSPEPQKPAPETSNANSDMFWTNGGLLGLKPSKPPDFSLENALPQDPSSKDDENNRKASCKISPADSATRHGNTGNSDHQSNYSSTVASTAASRSLLPRNSEFQDFRNQGDNITNSSQNFELNNRLFTMGANGKLLHDWNESTSPASYQTTGAFEQKHNKKISHQTFSGASKDLIGVETPVLSPSTSPPLEHMKISFQPIDGFETSKLKLKFPDRNCNNESSACFFPSFQLVPEVSGTLQNDGSDSDDDDTFYRSSPSFEDGCINRQSESDSDRWELGESPCSKDHEFCDSFHQISLTESVSSVSGSGRENREDNLENCEVQSSFVENGVRNSKSQDSFDLQSSDTQTFPFREELIKHTNSQYPSGPQFMISPATPPLPPAQWRGMKPNNNSEASPKASTYAFDLELSESTLSQQPKPAPLNQNRSFENSDVHNSKKSSLKESDAKQKDNRQKGGIDKEDFLHQIRTRSFNLRPTMTTKPFVQSVGHANIKVTDIMKKANAVRQAVGSDDDGNWSDP